MTASPLRDWARFWAKRVRGTDDAFVDIGDKGAVAVAGTLKANATLTELDLSDNRVGAEGAVALGETLRTIATLEVLAIDDNRISDKGMVILREARKAATASPKASKPTVAGGEVSEEQHPPLAADVARAAADVRTAVREARMMHLRGVIANMTADRDAAGWAGCIFFNSLIAGVRLELNDLVTEQKKSI